MPSYVVTWASLGIGFEFVRQLSDSTYNLVSALVPNKGTTTKLTPLLGRNIHVLQVDSIANHQALKIAAAEVSKHTGGKLDVLINNAAFIEHDRANLPLTAFDGKEDVLEKDLHDSFETNVIGVIHTINAFLPLLRAGPTKKVVTLSTGVTDPDFLEKSHFNTAAPYDISKAATNMVVTKYAIQLKDEGFIFLALSPGLVNTLEKQPTPEELAGYTAMIATF